MQRDQVSPVLLLDRLSEAITSTEYVWLNQLQQNNTVVTMAGIGTSLNAIADFVTSLENTGYFTNITLVNAQDTAAGQLGETSWTADRSLVLARRVSGDTFLILLGEPGLRVGFARYLLRRAAWELRPQFEKTPR